MGASLRVAERILSLSWVLACRRPARSVGAGRPARSVGAGPEELGIGPHAQSELQLEAPFGLVQGGAEQLAQPHHPVADRLRVNAELVGDRLTLSGAAQPRLERQREV